MGMKTTHLKIFLLLFFITIAGYGQIVTFDGYNCIPPAGDEWGTPDVVDGDDTPTGTADILNFWFDQDNQYVYMAFDREATGISSFSFLGQTSSQSNRHAFPCTILPASVSGKVGLVLPNSLKNSTFIWCLVSHKARMAIS